MTMTWTSEEERKAYHRAMAHEEVAAAYAAAGLTGMRGVIAAIREERRREVWQMGNEAIRYGQRIATDRIEMLAGHARHEPETAIGGRDGE